MEKLPGNLEKIVEQKSWSNLPKRIKRWDMLFVDDHGKVISFHHIKVVVIFFLILLLLLISGSIFLFSLYKDTKKKTVELQSALELSRQDYKAVQQEMHALMVRLAEAQSSGAKSHTKKRVGKVKKAPAPTKKASSPKKQFAKATTPISPKKRVSAPTKVTQKTDNKPQPKPSRGKIEVGVFDFSAFNDSVQNILTSRFIIKNLNRNIPDISGYIFVLLKENNPDQEKWFSIPVAELVSGKPARVKAGRFFKIRNYKTVELKYDRIQGPKTFSKATVMIFSKTEELLLKKSYRVEINVPGPLPKIVEEKPETSAPENATGEQEDLLPSDTVNSSPETTEYKAEEKNIQKEIPNSNANTDAVIAPPNPNGVFLETE